MSTGHHSSFFFFFNSISKEPLDQSLELSYSSPKSPIRIILSFGTNFPDKTIVFDIIISFFFIPKITNKIK